MDITQVYLGPSDDNAIRQNSATRQLLEYVSTTIASTSTGFSLATGSGLTGGPVTIAGGSISVDPTFFQGYLGGLTLSNDAGAPNSVIDIAKGVCCSDDQSALLKLSAATKTTTGTFLAGTGKGGLDAGTIANSTWYHVYIIGGSGLSNDALFSTSPTTPAMPSGYTVKRRIGSVFTSTSATIVAFTQNGDEFLWKNPPTDVNAVAVPKTQTFQTLTVPMGVNVSAYIQFRITSAGITDRVALWAPDMGDQTSNTWLATNLGQFKISTANTDPAGLTYIRTNTSGQISSVSSSTSAQLILTTFGWLDRRGRDS